MGEGGALRMAATRSQKRSARGSWAAQTMEATQTFAQAKAEPIRVTPWNTRELAVTDPDGHVLVFSERHHDPEGHARWHKVFEQDRQR